MRTVWGLGMMWWSAYSISLTCRSWAVGTNKLQWAFESDSYTATQVRMCGSPSLRPTNCRLRTNISIFPKPKVRLGLGWCVWRARATGSPQDTGSGVRGRTSRALPIKGGLRRNAVLNLTPMKDEERGQFSAGLSRGPGIAH